MTNERQPEALRLAKILEDHYFYADTNEAAAELRRLHAENEDYGSTIDYLTCENAEQIGEIVALKEQRDELRNSVKRLHAAKGRYHTQHAICDLFDLCGLRNERPKND